MLPVRTEQRSREICGRSHWPKNNLTNDLVCATISLYNQDNHHARIFFRLSSRRPQGVDGTKRSPRAVFQHQNLMFAWDQRPVLSIKILVSFCCSNEVNLLYPICKGTLNLQQAFERQQYWRPHHDQHTDCILAMSANMFAAVRPMRSYFLGFGNNQWIRMAVRGLASGRSEMSATFIVSPRIKFGDSFLMGLTYSLIRKYVSFRKRPSLIYILYATRIFLNGGGRRELLMVETLDPTIFRHLLPATWQDLWVVGTRK